MKQKEFWLLENPTMPLDDRFRVSLNSDWGGTRVIKYSEYEIILEKLKTAIKFLNEGKAKFSPNTTNSFVDDFLKENSHFIK